ncbi:MAG: PAS domain-containing protein [Chloroflexi bacterium]|nr:PAS domain-containing protein [Chloroflexota bacterium]
MNALPVYILDKDPAVGEWILNQLREIAVEVMWMPTIADLLASSEERPPAVCLVALRPPVSQALALITELTQEPRFARSVFILMGPGQYKRAAFEAGADDYITTPPDVIELRKRVRLYLDRFELEQRVMAETRISQEIQALGEGPRREDLPPALAELADAPPMTLLEHMAGLMNAKDRIEGVLRFAGDAICLISPDGIVQYANPASERLLGQAMDCIVGRRIQWPPQSNNPMISRQIAQAVEDAETWRGDIQLTLDSGRTLETATTLTPVFTPDNTVSGFVLIQRDITQRRALETLKTNFLADAAMEMRTPVTNIKMRQYLLQQAPPDQHPMHLQSLERETERLSRLVEAMLELSRLDSGTVELNLEPIDLNRLVADVVVRYSPAAEDKGVTLALTRTEKPLETLVDTGQLSRAVGILVDNAIQYTPDAGHIEVHLGRETWTGGAFLTIQVKDTGMGIEDETLPHVFERFYRSERVRNSGIRGVGLGLAIASELVKRHNGHITAESKVNAGSTFTIWLQTQNEK